MSVCLTDKLLGDQVLDYGLGRPGHWVLACEDLAGRGLYAALLRHISGLVEAFPETDYFASMAKILTHIPEPSAERPAFLDQAGATVQVAPFPGSDTVLLCFCGVADRLGLNNNIMHAWLSHLPFHIVYLRGFWPVTIAGNRAYAGSDPAQALQTLKEVIAGLGVARVLCWGNSLGGYSAIHYGLELGAQAVMAIAPKTNLDPATNPFARPSYSGDDLRPAYLAAKVRPRTCVIYANRHPEDNYHALHFGEVPDTELWAVDDSNGHNVVIEVIAAGHLDRVTAWVKTAGSDGLTGMEKAA